MVNSRFPAFSQLLVFSALPCLLAAQTSVNLTVSPNPSVFGAPVTLTATVTPTFTTGRVTFFDGATVLGTRSLSFGTASISTILLPSGIRRLRALYYNGENYVSSTSNVVTQRVNTVAEGGLLVHDSLSILPVQPSAVAVADFNGDGEADLVMAGFYAATGVVGSKVVVALGNGGGGFQTPVTYNVTTPDSVVVEDFDGDGVPDLAVSGIELNILLGNGDGTFRQGSSYSAVGRVVVADFNGDGVADLAVGGSNIWIGNGDGTFRPPVSTAADTETFMVGDFNGDGKADLLLTGIGSCNSINKPTCYDDVAALYLGNGDGTFQSPIVVFQGQGASMPSLVPRLVFAVEDFNGDGTPDFVFVDRNSFIFLPGEGDGTFGTPKVFSVSVTGGVVTSLTTGDFNGDGIVDLAAITVSPDPNVAITVSTVNLLIGNGDGTFQPSVNQAIPGFAGPLAVADFNGDGKADFIIANFTGGSMSVLLGASGRVHPVRHRDSK